MFLLSNTFRILLQRQQHLSLKTVYGSVMFVLPLSWQWCWEPRGSGGGEAREWSEKTTGGDPPQGDQFNRTILGPLGYKWSSTLGATTDNHRAESDRVLRSCRRIEKDDLGESVLFLKKKKNCCCCCCTPQADIYKICSPVTQTSRALLRCAADARATSLSVLHLCWSEWHGWRQLLRGLCFTSAAVWRRWWQRIRGQYMFSTGGQKQHICVAVGKGWAASPCACVSEHSWQRWRAGLHLARGAHNDSDLFNDITLNSNTSLYALIAFRMRWISFFYFLSFVGDRSLSLHWLMLRNVQQ